jgi:hypothetical protein
MWGGFPHKDAHRREKGIGGRDLGQREREILLDVVSERLEGRNIEDLGLVRQVGSLAEEGVDRGKEGGQRLARSRGGGDQDVAALADEGPPLPLGRRRLPQAGGEPLRHGRMERIKQHLAILLSPCVKM